MSDEDLGPLPVSDRILVEAGKALRYLDKTQYDAPSDYDRAACQRATIILLLQEILHELRSTQI